MPTSKEHFLDLENQKQPTETGSENFGTQKKEQEFTREKERQEEQVEITDKNKKKKKAPSSFSLSKIKSKPIPQYRDDMAIAIEKIMEQGLEEEFQKLSPIARQEFKLRGEQNALKIREILSKSKVKAKKIFELILNWLRILPGINKFFLEQEAKIKTDKILRIKDK